MSEVQPNLKTYYEPYTYFARTLRAWLVAYGIGAPLLVASQAELSRKLVSTGNAEEVVITFLLGMLIQIGTALLYKYTLWRLHLGELLPNGQQQISYRLARWFYLRLWPTVMSDLTTLALFVWPTYALLTISTK